MTPAHSNTDYRRGVRNGCTQATLKSIAKSIDEIHVRLDNLRCDAHDAWLKALWVLVPTQFAAIGGLAAVVLVSS